VGTTMKIEKLLVVGNMYRRLIKDTVVLTSQYFDQINVLVRYNPIVEFSNIIPINCLKPLRKKLIIDLKNNPGNVDVTTTPIFYAPTDSQYKKLGEKHFKAAEKTIDKNNIKFDLIHSHFTWSAGYAGAKLKEKYGVPFIVTAHGYDIYDLPFRDDEWKEKIKYVLNAADYIITVSNSNLECIKKLNVKTLVKVIPNGFNSNLFCPRESNECGKTLSLPLDKEIILTVGNLEVVKGHKYLIEAMKEVVKRNKNVLCIIVGSGKLKNKLEKQIKKAGLENYVKLAGGKPHDEIPIWMNACDLFVLPSFRESFGVVQIEAMACGKPVVATYNGGSEEIITSEDYGFLVEPANPKDLAEKILIALEKEWADEKIRKYAEQFRIENNVKEVLEVYKHII
jgi:glycosyltransferase involved in cell wall biosynthesis